MLLQLFCTGKLAANRPFTVTKNAEVRRILEMHGQPASTGKQWFLGDLVLL